MLWEITKGWPLNLRGGSLLVYSCLSFLRFSYLLHSFFWFPIFLVQQTLYNFLTIFFFTFSFFENFLSFWYPCFQWFHLLTIKEVISFCVRGHFFSLEDISQISFLRKCRSSACEDIEFCSDREKDIYLFLDR